MAVWNEGICHSGLCVSPLLACSAAQLRRVGSGRVLGAWQGEGPTVAGMGMPTKL